MTRTTRSRLILFAVVLAAVGATGPADPAAGRQAEVALTGATAVDVGDDHTCARLSTARVRCWGDNDNGQLGNNSVLDSDVPVTVLNLAGGGPLTGVSTVVAGDDHSCARLANGQARCWGDNDNGQLGNNSTADSDLPVTVLNPAGTAPLTGISQLAAGEDQTCARLTSGQARCWGQNNNGQLGDNTTTGRDTPRVVVGVGGSGALTGVARVGTGETHSCALLTSGQVRCWGDNSFGQVGDRTTTNRPGPVVVKRSDGPGALTGVTQLTTGENHTCARLGSGQARCWGQNAQGELGDGTTSVTLAPAPVANGGGDGNLAGVSQLEGGAGTTCARLTTGQVRCWGDNDNGQIGDGTIVSRRLPVTTRNPGDTGPLTSIAAVASGDAHTCALTSNGQVRCWGDNDNGQLGDDSIVDSPLPVVVQA